MRCASPALTTLCLLTCASCVSAQTLYNGAGNTTPDQAPWNWTYLQLPATPNVTGVASNGATTLDTTALTSLKAGYARLAPQTLDNAAGYTLTFDLQTLAETHNSFDRAGCDVIVLGDDHRGVELGFWTNAVWAQTDTFTHAGGAEARAFDTTQGLIHYTLRVEAGAYTLTAGATPLLSGSLHLYPALPGTPYGVPDFLFIGDDTTSASASLRLAGVTVVPEPGAAALLAGAGAALLTARRRRRGRQAKA